MPTYRWSGRTKQGALISGTQEADSQDDVARGLRERGLVVMSVAAADSAATPDEAALLAAGHPVAGVKTGSVFRAIIGLALLAGGFILLNIATGTWIDCVRDPAGASQCRVEKRMAGVRLLSTESLQIAKSASSEELTTVSEDRSIAGDPNRPRGTSSRPSTSSFTRTRVVIDGPYGRVTTDWMAYPFPTSPTVAGRLTRFFEGGGAPAFASRQIETAPVGGAILFAIVGLWLLVSGLKRLLVG